MSFRIPGILRLLLRSLHRARLRAISFRPLAVSLLALVIPLVLLLAPTEPARAQPDNPGEYQIKAAFLYNFAKFTEWGTSSKLTREGTFLLCITGRDPFGPALTAIEGKLIAGQRLQVKLNVAMEDVGACQMLFVSDSEERRVAAILKAARQYPILTVSDIEGFADTGGMVGLMLADNRIQFDINMAAANAANLKISSQLLRLARTVIGAKGRNG